MDNAGVELDIERTPSNQGGSMKPESTPSTETTGNKTSEPICASVSVDPNDKNDAETKALRIMLKLYFYAAFKWKDNRCSFHIIYCIIFMMQIVKVLLITDQMFRFGQARSNFSSQVNRGHLTLKHLLLKDWSASWETLPYPPSHGAFALYTIDDLESGINFAVTRKTKQFMKKKKEDLPAAEYFRFLKLWDILVFLSDTMTISGTRFVISDTKETEWILETFDSYTVWLGIGCVFAWLSLLRFFKFNIKFHLLFSTLYRAFFDVMAYLLCVIVLFIGFWVCGYVVLGPYHVKFRTPETAAEALFAIVNGDEIYATLAILENEKSRSIWVFWFSRFYIWTYVAIFTVVVYNLLIALFMNAYDSIKDYYAEKQDDRNLSPMEKALRRYLTDREEMKNKSSASTNNNLSKHLYDFRTGTDEASDLRHEMLKLVKVREQEKDVVFVQPRTLKAFMEAEEDQIKYFNCCCFEVSFVLFKSKDVMQA